MITLYCKTGDSQCLRIHEELEELVIAHELVEVSGGGDARLPEHGPLPLLVDGPRRVHGLAAVESYLEELGRFASLWRKYQSDACYCDDEGNVE